MERQTSELLAGVLQGDTLAPHLFIIVLDYALRIDDREEDLIYRKEKVDGLAQKLFQTLTLLMTLPYCLRR